MGELIKENKINIKDISDGVSQMASEMTSIDDININIASNKFTILLSNLDNIKALLKEFIGIYTKYRSESSDGVVQIDLFSSEVSKVFNKDSIDFKDKDISSIKVKYSNLKNHNLLNKLIVTFNLIGKHSSFTCDENSEPEPYRFICRMKTLSLFNFAQKLDFVDLFTDEKISKVKRKEMFFIIKNFYKQLSTIYHFYTTMDTSTEMLSIRMEHIFHDLEQHPALKDCKRAFSAMRTNLKNLNDNMPRYYKDSIVAGGDKSVIFQNYILDLCRAETKDNAKTLRELQKIMRVVTNSSSTSGKIDRKVDKKIDKIAQSVDEHIRKHMQKTELQCASKLIIAFSNKAKPITKNGVKETGFKYLDEKSEIFKFISKARVLISELIKDVEIIDKSDDIKMTVLNKTDSDDYNKLKFVARTLDGMQLNLLSESTWVFSPDGCSLLVNVVKGHRYDSSFMCTITVVRFARAIPKKTREFIYNNVISALITDFIDVSSSIMDKSKVEDITKTEDIIKTEDTIKVLKHDITKTDDETVKDIEIIPMI